MKWDELVLFRWDVLLICSNSLKKHKMSSRLTVPELQQFWSEVCIQSSAEWMMIQEMDIIHLKTAIRLIHFNFGFYVTSHCVKITDNSLSVCRSIFLAVCLFSCHSSCLYLCIPTSVCLSLCLCAFLNVSISVLSLYIFLDIYVFCLSYLCMNCTWKPFLDKETNQFLQIPLKNRVTTSPEAGLQLQDACGWGATF